MKTILKIGAVLCLNILLFSNVPAQLSDESNVEEHLGNNIPLDLMFLNENGDSVKLGDLIKKPTILSLVYFRCPGICSPLLSGLVEVVEKIDEKPGEDYQLLTISFDPTDNPAMAVKKKNNYLKSFNIDFPEEQWHFLTGDSAAIYAITKAVGFKYKQTGDDFVHPGLVTMLGADGKITRYLFGISFLPFDVKMALLEAAQGRTGPTINKVLLYCFSYDPTGKQYAFNFLKVTGTIIIFLVLIFVVFLIFVSRARRKKVRMANVG